MNEDTGKCTPMKRRLASGSTAICILALCLGRSLPSYSQQSARVDSVREANQVDPDLSHIRDYFGQQYFQPRGGFILRQGQRLPELVWENADSVAAVVAEPAIPTRWFNASLREVHTADKVGRYFVYGEGPTPSGPPLRRAMTCVCVARDEDLGRLAVALVPDISRESDPDLRQALTDSVLGSWTGSEEGAVSLAALMEGGPGREGERVGQWMMENATRHVQLKRRTMGLDGRPESIVRARLKPGAGSPVLRSGSSDEVDISAKQIRALEERLDAWYAAAGQPNAVVVARKGVILLAKSYGELDGEPVTVDTPMLLHSAMKPLIGLQLAMYVDRGLIDLDEPMGNYLPDFRSEQDVGLTFRAAHVHATGIAFPWPLAFSRLFYFRTWQDALIAHQPREWAPGARRQYGVVGIILSVRAVELLSGRNYWDAMERELFAPLGVRNILPGGTGFSAENLGRVGVLLANGGTYGDQEFFKRETYEAILPTSLTPYFPQIDKEYGIGLQSYATGLGPGSYGHAGGCGTQLIVNPEEHLVFAMVRNDRGEEYKEHLNRALEVMRSWKE